MLKTDMLFTKGDNIKKDNIYSGGFSVKSLTDNINFTSDLAIPNSFTNINQFRSFLNTQKLIRGMDEVHIIEADGTLYLTTLKDISTYRPPLPEALEMVLNDKRPLKIINAYKNQSSSIIKLENFEGKYLDCGTMKGYINSTLEVSKI